MGAWTLTLNVQVKFDQSNGTLRSTKMVKELLLVIRPWPGTGENVSVF
jgi:hypothetical protein